MTADSQMPISRRRASRHWPRPPNRRYAPPYRPEDRSGGCVHPWRVGKKFEAFLHDGRNRRQRLSLRVKSVVCITLINQYFSEMSCLNGAFWKSGFRGSASLLALWHTARASSLPTLIRGILGSSGKGLSPRARKAPFVPMSEGLLQFNPYPAPAPTPAPMRSSSSSSSSSGGQLLQRSGNVPRKNRAPAGLGEKDRADCAILRAARPPWPYRRPSRSFPGSARNTSRTVYTFPFTEALCRVAPDKLGKRIVDADDFLAFDH